MAGELVKPDVTSGPMRVDQRDDAALALGVTATLIAGAENLTGVAGAP
jgi:hypothetical protein